MPASYSTPIFRYRMTQPRTLRAAARLMETGFDHATVVEDVLCSNQNQNETKGRMLERMVCVNSGRFAYSFLTQDEAEFDTGGLVDELVFIDGIQVGILCRAQKRRKVSIRSRNGCSASCVPACTSWWWSCSCSWSHTVGSLDDVLSPALDLLANFMAGADEPVHMTKTAAR